MGGSPSNWWLNAFGIADRYSWNGQLQKAYDIYRRLYDRIPFHFAMGHAQSLGKVTRTYQELGRRRELDFILGRLRDRQGLNPDPLVDYSVLFLESALKVPGFGGDVGHARSLSRDLSDPKLRFNLGVISVSQYFQTRDYDAALALITAIKTKNAEETLTLELWRGGAVHHLGKFQQSEDIIRSAVRAVDPKSCNWHLYSHALVHLGKLYRDQEKWADLGKVARELRFRFPRNRFRGIRGACDEFAHSNRAGLAELH